MPANTTKTTASDAVRAPRSARSMSEWSDADESVRNGWGSFGKKITLTLASVALVYLIFFLGTLIRNNTRSYHFIGQADKPERTITINGSGRVTGSNDIAVTTIGYTVVNKDVAEAQIANKRVMDQVVNELRRLEIAEKDLRTNYSVGPEYNFTQDKGQELKGYRVTHSVTVKIRDLSKITSVLGLAGKYGATEVSGLEFTIDDREELKNEARDKALADAREKAEYLAAVLGVRLVGVVSYNEYEGGDVPLYYERSIAPVSGMGGGAPGNVPAGSNDVTMNVNVTYEMASRSR